MPTVGDLPSTLPVVPLAPVNNESLEAEIKALCERGFTPTNSHAGDLIADSEEMLGASEDIEALLARGFKVSASLIDRLRLLSELLAPKAAERDRETTAASLPKAERVKARKRLLQIRSRLAALATAGGLPSTLFELATTRTTRLNVVVDRVTRVLDNARSLIDSLPDRAQVEALIAEGNGILARVRTLRSSGALSNATSMALTDRYQAAARLLLDTLVYLSRQGRAAFPDDPSRYARYALDHVYGRRPSVAGDPGAGGKNGHADVVDPDDPIDEG